MKPLTKEQQEEAVRLIRTLVQKVKKYSVSHAADYRTTPQHRLHDSLALADATQQADDWSRDLDHENVVAGMEYQRNVIEALTKEIRNPTRLISEPPVLDDDEMEEMREAFESGMPSSEFAEMLYNRDIGKAERAQEQRDSSGNGGMSERDRQDIIDAGRGHLVR